MTSSSPHLARREHFPFSRLWRVGLLATLVAVGVTAGISTLTVTLLHVPRSFLPLTIGSTVSFATLGVVGATLVFALLIRFVKRPVRIFALVAVLVLALSFIPAITLVGNPLPSFAGGTVLTVGVLLFEHVLVAVISVSMLTTLGYMRKA